MRVIDAHMHLFPSESRSNAMAQAVGHENSVSHLRNTYQALGWQHAVVMGNRSLDPDYHAYDADLFHYCVGLDSAAVGESFPDGYVEMVEENLKKDTCCGVKLYPGYCHFWLSNALYDPIYRLAEKYDKPVAVHMGLTNGRKAHLKYSHPLTLDEVAAKHYKVRFVMCHLGNPFLDSMAAVLDKNRNVTADLSGLLEGRFDIDTFFLERSGYVTQLQTWLSYIARWDSIMFGTDWPIVNLKEYQDFIARVIPQRHHESVFYKNANHIYQLGLPD